FVLLTFCDSPSSDSYTLSLHDALPISFTGLVRIGNADSLSSLVSLVKAGSERFLLGAGLSAFNLAKRPLDEMFRRNHSSARYFRSEEHTSELQSRVDLVCRLLLEKKHQ